MKLQYIVPALCIALVAVATPVAASEAQGTVTDLDGNPIAGAVVKFVNSTAPDAVYEVKTNKKGKFFLPNMVYYPPGKWKVNVTAEGYTQRHIKVESRKGDRTRLGVYETGMLPDKPHEVMISGLGKAELEFLMVSDDQLEAEQQKYQEERAAELAEVNKQERAKAAAKDPFGAAQGAIADGDLEGSIEHFRKALEDEPADAERRVLYVKVLYKLERYREAAAVARETIGLDSELAEINLILAEIYMKQDNLDGAMEALEREAELSPEDVRIHQRRAWIADQQGDVDGAIAANEKIVAMEPGNLEAWLALGDFYASKGDQTKATEAFDRVVELDPDNAYKTFYNIGVLIENKDDPSEAEERRAVEAFRKAVQIKPDYVPAHRHLAYALLRQGDLKGARQSFEQVLSLDPDARDAEQIRSMVSGLPQ
jgi:tetratricopeptide (TPR) repeat protein